MALRRGQPVAVLGLPGTGKTFLLRRLTQLLASEGHSVRRFEALQVAAPEHRDDILLVDEADRLPGATLDRLCDRPGPFILAGLPELAGRLADRARPIATVMLEPLSPEDVARFVAARLSATGHRRDLFEAEAVLALARHSAGLPRLIVMLAGSAMLLAAHEACAHVGVRHVDEAVAMRTGTATQVAPTELEGPARHLATIAEPRMAAAREQAEQPVPFLRDYRIPLGLGGAVVLGLLGLMLVPLDAPPSPATQPSQPVREASLAGPAEPRADAPPPPIASAPAPAEAVPPEPPPAVPVQSAADIPPPVAPKQVEAALSFQGPILNETMNQNGRLSLNIQRSGASGVTARFHAFAGLIGSGELTGTMTASGRITASGRLMMGRNPFDTVLTATMIGNKLEGVAVFSRPDASSLTRSRFSLLRS